MCNIHICISFQINAGLPPTRQCHPTSPLFVGSDLNPLPVKGQPTTPPPQFSFSVFVPI